MQRMRGESMKPMDNNKEDRAYYVICQSSQGSVI